MKLWTLESKRDEVLDDDPVWGEKERRKHRCPGCGQLDHDLYPQPLEAVVQMRQRMPVSLSGRSGVRILRRSLLNIFARPRRSLYPVRSDSVTGVSSVIL